MIDSRDARCAHRSNKLFPATCVGGARPRGGGGEIGKASRQSADKQLTDNKRFCVCG